MSTTNGEYDRIAETLVEEDQPRSAVGREVDLVARESLLPVAFWLGVLYAALAVGQLLLLGPAEGRPLAATAFATAALLFAFRVYARFRPMPGAAWQPAGLVVVGLVLANSLLYLLLSGDLPQTAPVMLALLGAAFLLPSTAWFFAAFGGVVLGWTAAAAAVIAGSGASDDLIDVAVGMAASAVLAVVIHGARAAAVRRIELSSVRGQGREEEMRRVFALSQDLLCVMRPDGTITSTNPAIVAALGVAQDDLEGRSILSLVHPDDRLGVAARLASVGTGAGKLGFESRLCAADGSVRWVLWQMVALAEGGLVHAAGRDITERKRMEEKLRLSYIALESAGNGVLITDTSGAITWVNPTLTRMTGYPAAELEGRNPRVLKSGQHDEAFYRDLWSTIGAGLVWTGQIVNRRKDGSLYREEQTIAPVRDANGDVTHYFAVKSDVTARVKAEEVIRDNARRLEQELDLALEVQGGLVPQTLPELEAFDVAAEARPARFVSGDLYDWMPIGAGACLFVTADISGKGMAAAMLSAAARTLTRSLATPGSSPAALLAGLNRALYDELSRVGMFITVFVAILDVDRGEVLWANAGHPPAYVVRGGSRALERLAATALPLGVLESCDAVEHSLALVPGDLLLLYSDGVTEAAGPGGELFGDARLAAALVGRPGGTARDAVDAVLAAVGSHCREEPQSDDVTIVALRARERSFPFTTRTSAAGLEEVLRLAREASGRFGARFAYETELLMSELITNAGSHSYGGVEGEFRGRIDVVPDGVRIETWDDGEPLDPAAAPPALGTLREGGYGLHIVRALAAEALHEAVSGRGNHWQIRRTVTAEGARHGG